MKRTALSRKAPHEATRRPRSRLTPSGRRTPAQAAHFAAERSAVMERDRQCIALKLTLRRMTHADDCRNQWGDLQSPAEPLTLGHIRTDPGGARRDDRRFMVAECAWHNLVHWESANIEAVNAYLDELYPERRNHL